MIPQNGVTMHPGKLLRELLEENGISQGRLAEHIGVPIQRINLIVNEKRGITADTAWRLAAAFGQSARFWMGLQTMHDLTANRIQEMIPPIVELEPIPQAQAMPA